MPCLKMQALRIPRNNLQADPTLGTLFTSDFRRDTLALWGSFFACLLAVYLGFNWIPSMLTGAGVSKIAFGINPVSVGLVPIAP